MPRLISHAKEIKLFARFILYKKQFLDLCCLVFSKGRAKTH